jgi:hypothetical protein
MYNMRLLISMHFGGAFWFLCIIDPVTRSYNAVIFSSTFEINSEESY